MFVLAENKEIMIRDMIHGVEEYQQGRSRWRRWLLESEEQAKMKMTKKIQRINLNENEKDTWTWLEKTYSVREACDMLLTEYMSKESSDLKVAWNDLIPLKASILVWIIFQNKIPTKDNLIKREIIYKSQKTCSFGCDKEENTSYVFLDCTVATKVW